MKKSLLKQIIKEEIYGVLNEVGPDNDKIDNLIKYLEESIYYAKKLKTEGPNEMQDFGSLVLSIQDGLNQF